MAINSYGQTLSQVDTRSRPKKNKTSYGYHTICYQDADLLLQKFDICENLIIPFRVYLKSKITYFVEDGSLLIYIKNCDGELNLIDVGPGELFEAEALCIHAFYAKKNSQIYSFSDSSILNNFLNISSTDESSILIKGCSKLGAKGLSTQDKRQKYWGTIETILSSDIAGKKMSINAFGQSSLEYHVNKTEVYYIHSGELQVGLRTGRAENSILTLHCGDSFVIYPGTMHMRIACSDTVVFEISTADSDADSHIVEDGMTYMHKIK